MVARDDCLEGLCSILPTPTEAGALSLKTSRPSFRPSASVHALGPSSDEASAPSSRGSRSSRAKPGVLLCPRVRVSRKAFSVVVEAQLPAVAHHDGLAAHDGFFAGSTGDRAVDGCRAGQLPVGFAAPQVGSGDGGHGCPSASTCVAGQPLWPRGCFGLPPCPSNAVCESSFSGRSRGSWAGPGRWLGGVESMLCGQRRRVSGDVAAHPAPRCSALETRGATRGGIPWCTRLPRQRRAFGSSPAIDLAAPPRLLMLTARLHDSLDHSVGDSSRHRAAASCACIEFFQRRPESSLC